MSTQVFIGDRNFSSWSLRAWLLFEKFEIEHTTTRVWLDSREFHAQIAAVSPARTVPAIILPDESVVFDTLAIAETLAERYPDRGLWPGRGPERGRARAITAEMHSSFGALRNDCPMNLRRAYVGFTPSSDVRADLARIEELWDWAGFGGGDGWLFGDFSIADAFFAPVVGRVVTYDLAVGPAARAYCARVIADPAFRRWRATGLGESSVHVDCDLSLPERPWPGPAPMAARPVVDLEPVNATCPFSGQPVQPDSLAAIDGRTVGFCDPACRDKAVADPEAWPAVMALLAEG